MLIPSNASAGSNSVATTTANGIWYGSIQARYFRLNVTGISAGTTAGTIIFSTAPKPAQFTPINNPSVTAAASTGSTVPAGAFYKGLLAQTANPTAATAGNLVGALSDKLGKQVVVGSIRDLKVTQQTTITSSVTETTVLTAVASTFLDVYGVIITNTSATACEVVFRDATAGTVRFSVMVPASDTREFMLPESAAHVQSAVNNNWTATCGTSVASIKITMLAVKNT